jgi:hypothetical protein
MGIGTCGRQHGIFDGDDEGVADDDPKEETTRVTDPIARVTVPLVRPTRRSCSSIVSTGLVTVMGWAGLSKMRFRQ